MYDTYTVLFMDYQGYPDHEMYTAVCAADAVRQFERDHPGRKLIFAGRVVGKAGAWKKLGMMVHATGAEVYYQGLYQEEQTGHFSIYEFSASNDDAAVEHYHLALQEAQEVRADAGGFGLNPVGLWCLYPYKTVADYRLGA